MLHCPKCGRAYETDTQKFCTHDGGRLVPDGPAASDEPPVAYDLNQTVRIDTFDPEETVTRMPDLNKTVATMQTSELRSKETGPATPPPANQPATPLSVTAPYQNPEPPPSGQQARDVQPTVAFNQPQPPPQQPYYQTPPPVPGSPTSFVPMPQPSPGQPYAQGYQPSAGVARKKSSRLPLMIGLVVLVLLGGAAAWYFLVYKKGDANASGNANVANSDATAQSNTSADISGNSNAAENITVETPPPPDSTQFLNSSANLDGRLAENYSDFSFYYPNSWEKDPKTGVAGASNFVKVERRLPPDFTQENFAVSWYLSKGTFEADQADVFPKLVESLKSRYATSFPEFEVLSEGETSINGIKGYEFRFRSMSRETEKGDIMLWGRVVFLPPGVEGKTNGVQLLMLTTSLAPELSSAEDIGAKGELPIILNSFKMGSSK